jgi:hypothetical protein
MSFDRASLLPDSGPLSGSVSSTRMPASSVRGDGRTVLLLGRDRFGAASMARSIVGAGFKVTTVFEAEDVERAVASESFHAILCDELAANVFSDVLHRAVEAHRSAVIVTGCRDTNDLEVVLRDSGIDTVCGVPAGASAREIIFTLARCTA